MKSEFVDLLLTPLDPLRALRRIVSDVDRLAALDPKVGEARHLVTERLTSALASTPDGEEIVAGIFWLHLRGQLTNEPALLTAFRAWLGDGDLVLRTTELALDTVLSSDVLRETVTQAGQLSDAPPPQASPLDQARRELRRLQGERPADNPVAIAVGVAFLAGVLSGYVMVKFAHHPGKGPLHH
jgi:hypothetical protein